MKDEDAFPTLVKAVRSGSCGAILPTVLASGGLKSGAAPLDYAIDNVQVDCVTGVPIFLRFRGS